MSGKASGRVWDMDLPHNKMLILLAMADHADHQGRKIYPGLELIAWKTGYSLATVQRTIDELVNQDGILEITKQGGGRGHPTEYAINFAAAPAKAPYRSKKGSKMTPFNPGNIETPEKGVKMLPFSDDKPSQKGSILDAERVAKGCQKGSTPTLKNPLTVNLLTLTTEPRTNEPSLTEEEQELLNELFAGDAS